MALLTQTQGYGFLFAFGIVLIAITYFFARWKNWQTKEGFLVAERRVNWLIGGPSIAASWIWAGALFVATQMAYEKGIAGLFWFTFPNVLALAIFAFLGPKIREKFSQGFTLPQFIHEKLRSKKVHNIYLFGFFFYQLLAITFNIFAGGNLISLLTGIPATTVMIILAVLSLIYTLISGLEASIVTDVVQLVTILTGIAVIVPLAISAAGGISSISSGLGGISGSFRNILDPSVALSFGIVTSIGLISSTIIDQQHWQRVFALKKKDISKAFIFGAILFALVPISLAMLGFIGASSETGITMEEGADPALIGVLTVSQLLAPWATVFFTLILLAGISSTIDSAISATSALWATDVAKGKNVLKSARLSMMVITVLGLLVSYAAYFIPGFGMAQLFMLTISIAASLSMPTILSLYWNRLSAEGVFKGAVTAMVIGMPIFIYANLINNSLMIAGSSLFMILISTLFCLLMPKSNSSS